MKKFLAFVLALAMVLALAACGGNSGAGNNSGNAGNGGDAAGSNDVGSTGGKTVTVGATPAPHAAILEVAKKLMEADGYTLDIKEFDDYVTPNTSLEDGSLDANYFQHVTYMNDFNDERGAHLVNAAGIHYEPLGLYGGKTASLADLADGAKIAVPNDATNEARALLLLEQEGLIKLKEGVGVSATKSDVEENPHNFEFVEMEARLTPTVLQDVDMAVVNGNYAIDAGLKIADALAVESAEGDAAEAYVNVIAVKEGNENDEGIQELIKCLKSDEVKSFIEETYEGAVVPLF
ncbi:MAG: ABC transporter substrate-binding protein [Oscillospiraceae bacterium]|nr:ABC transporter substrate-binding protein [Oscillospiraceae bacterium]